MDLIVEILFWPFAAFFQAFAGILYPTRDPRLVRAQRIALALMLLSITCVVAAILLGWTNVGGWPRFWMVIAAAVMMIVAGSIGHHIEKNFKRDGQGTKETSDTAE